MRAAKRNLFGRAVRVLLAAGAVSAAASGQTTQPAGPVGVSAAQAAIEVDPATGRIVSIRVAGDEMAQPHPAGSDRPIGFLEVEDLHEGRAYNPLKVRSTISDWQTVGQGAEQGIRFRQQYDSARFSVQHTLRPTPVGVRWEASLRLAAGEELNRSVVVSWMLPLPFGWRFWGPNDTVSFVTDGVTPYRFVYAHTDHRPYATILPLVGAWGRKGGAAVFSPPDVRKCQITFDVATQRISDPGKGVHRRAEDLQMLRVAYQAVGLRPGKDLALAVCIAGCRPDWRAVLGHYVQSYPELFEPIPQARKCEGMYGITNASRISDESIQTSRARRVTCLEIHGHFPEYGIYITPEALADPDLKWRCKPHPGLEVSLASNRRIVARLNAAGVPAFMYFYNVHANSQTIQERFAADLMRNEAGEPCIQYQGEPALRAQPDSPFGKHLIEQMQLLLKAYPDTPGFFVDNFTQEWISFAHDDGVTMVHDRPAYTMNRNHQDIGPVIAGIAHKAGKVIMVNKLATIESARGADLVLVESMSVDGLKVHAFACVFRALFPLAWEYPRTAYALERCMQHLLIWGGTPAETLYRRRGQEDLEAYRPLTDAMIGKRWVFDPDPLELPEGYQGQIFRIDTHAPRAGDVVVSVVDLRRSWRDGKFTEGLSIVVSLPENEQLAKAAWLSVEKSAEPAVSVPLERQGGKLLLRLPPVGAAGILRLTR